MSAQGVAQPPEVLKIEIPRRFAFLLDLHPYKVAYGGRNGLKSWSFADAILALGANQQLRIVCGREVMKSLADSCHKLLSDRIKALGLANFYTVFENKIRGRNGTEISYAGLSEQTDESIKSFEGVDIFWAEEAQGISDGSWSKLLPTIMRKPNAEVWVSFNPDMITDATYQRFVVHPPPGAKVVNVNYDYAAACGFMSPQQDLLRLHDKQHLPLEEYENIWLGKPRMAVKGAIFSREVVQMIEERRYRPTPYDPRFPVDVIWDLGWNDAMVQLFVQKVSPTALNLINYREDSGRRYDELIEERKTFRYRFGVDWLPHDGSHKNPQTGKSAKQTLEGLHCRVKVMEKTGPEPRIKAARQMFPRIYIDDTAREVSSGYLGAARLMECLKSYKRNIPTTTNEPTSPVHDEFSHGCDAFGALAEIVDKISSEFIQPAPPRLAAFHTHDAGMGPLG